MKKQSSRAKAAPKTASRARTVKAVKSTKKTVVAKKKTTQRKGLIHHTKRMYHLTPKFVHGALVGAFFGVLFVTWIGSTGNARANPQANDCIKTNGGINVNDKHANVQVRTSACDKARKFMMKAWYAPSATGVPHEEQRLFAASETITVRPGDDGWTKLNVTALPDGCFYQYDLVDVTNPANNGDGNPIVAAATGGNRDCTPKPEYSCNSMTVKQGADRTVVIDTFRVTEIHATLKRVTVLWGDQSGPVTYTGNPVGSTHQYASDGTYNIQAAAYFTISAKNGEQVEKVAKQACTAQVRFTPITPGNQEVCEFKSGKIVQIPEGQYDTNAYGPTNAKECNPTITVTNTGSTLTNTGPGAILVVLAFAAVGGYTFHRTHHHIRKHIVKHVRRRAA